MKIVKFYKNTVDNTHCLQACIKMLLSFYFPKRKFEDSKIDQKTLQEGGHTWFPPAVCWLDELGLKTLLFCKASSFNYKFFANDREKYLKQKWPKERYQKEKDNGAFKNIDQVQNASKIMVSKKLWIPKRLNDDELSKKIEDDQTLAIGKTIHQWLSGIYTDGSPHYVLIQKRYSPTQWKVHDPGLPPLENRKVPVTINCHSIFGDILVVCGPRKSCRTERF